MLSRLTVFASVFLGVAIAPVNGFKFTNNALTECGALTVNWSGGTPPYNLLIIPPGQTLRNISIPSTSTGSFSTQIPFPQGQAIMLAMSDATGVTAGGITPLMTVGSPQGTTCNTTGPRADFFFSLESPLVQCANYPFTNFAAANQPVTAFGFAAGGSSFSLQAPQGSTSFSWKANFPAETQMAFYMTDAQGRNGGTSPIQTVGASSDATCLPSLTSSSAKPTSTNTSNTAAASGGANGQKGKTSGSKTGIIIGAAAGGFVLLGALAFLAIFCFRRKKSQGPAATESKIDLSYDPTVNTPAAPPNTYLLPSSYTHSITSLAPNPPAAPYAQTTQSSQGSQGYSPSTGSITPLKPNATHSTGGSDFSPYPVQQASSTAPNAQYRRYSQDGGSILAGSAQTYGYGAQGAAGVVTQGYYQQQYSQPQYPQQDYSQPQYPQQEYSQPQYSQQEYPRQQYPQQYQQQYQQQYPQYQQYPQAGNSQSAYTRGGGGSFYTTNNPDPEDTYDGYAYPPAPAPLSTSKPKQHNATNSGGSTGNVPQRVVVHQDIEESMDLAAEELPPRYSETRAPIPGLPSSQPLRDRKG